MNSDHFLWTCKELYLMDIHPFDLDKTETEPYHRIERLAKELIKKNGLQDFLGFLMEYQYCVNLWTAKLGLEFGNPNAEEILKISGKETVINFCIDVVKRNTNFNTTPLQEKNGIAWIKKIKKRYNNNN